EAKWMLSTPHSGLQMRTVPGKPRTACRRTRCSRLLRLRRGTCGLARKRGWLASDSLTPNADLMSRMRAGSYEAPATLGACLTGLAIAGRLVGVWLSAGFAIEAEMLYLMGVFLDLTFLRSLVASGLPSRSDDW